VTFKYRWLLNRGDHLGRFGCIQKFFIDHYQVTVVGWLYGSLNGVLGYFPEEYVKPLARHEVERSPSNVKVGQSIISS